MKLTIANLSTKVTGAELRAAVAAIGRQVREHFQPEWGVTATLKVIRLPLGRKKAPVEKDTDAVIYFGDSSNDPDTGVDDAEGYHSSNNKDIPYGFVYLDICAKAKDAWSCAHLRTGCAAQMGRPGSRTGLLSLCSRKHS
jgi:hypothetical protein